MVDFKEFLRDTKETLTSPTAYSWYGVAGVIATAVLTFVSTKRWTDYKNMHWISNYTKWVQLGQPEDLSPEEIDEEYKKTRTFMDKAKEGLDTALIFAPPAIAAIGSSYCIIHGNQKALSSIGDLTMANNLLSSRLDKYKGFAAGALASEVKNHTEEGEEELVSKKPHKIFFSDDDLEHEYYGKRTRFFIEYTQKEFYSTPLDVVMAEAEFNRLIWDRRVGEFGSLNELLDMLSAPQEPYGDYCGWSKDSGFDNGYSWVGIQHYKIDFDDGESGYMISFESEPTYDELYHKLIHG